MIGTIDSDGSALQRTYQFPNLTAVSHFVAMVIALGSEDALLPVITINYLEVTLRIAGPDGRALDESDLRLIRVIDLRV